MKSALCLVFAILLLVASAFAINFANENSRLDAKISELQGEKFVERKTLESKLSAQISRSAALATENEEQKNELRKLAEALENANSALEKSAVKSREQAAEIAKNKQLISDVEKKLKSAESALEEAKKTAEKEIAAGTPQIFELNQDVYTKRFLAISSRLNRQIEIEKKRNPPERAKKTAGTFGGFSSAESTPQHIRVAEKILRELEYENKPSQKLFAAISAEKQRWAADKSRKEYLSKCAIQLRRDLEQFSSPQKTYLDD